MKMIKLTKGKVAIVDDEDYDAVSRFKWYAVKGTGDLWYAMRSYRENGKKLYMSLHRLIMQSPSDKTVDHKDGDGLNCQRYNMRHCTHQQNMCNRKPVGGSSKYKGVSWDRCAGRWQAKIKINGIQKKIGYFASEIEAANAYNQAATQYHGEYAWLNLIAA